MVSESAKMVEIGRFLVVSLREQNFVRARVGRARTIPLKAEKLRAENNLKIKRKREPFRISG